MNNKRTARFFEYDKIFKKAGQLYNCKRILSELDSSITVQKSAFHKDIRFLENQFDIKWDEELRKDGFFRYEDTTFSIFPKSKDLSDKDIVDIKELLHLISRFRGSQQLNFLNETVVRLENQITNLNNKKNEVIEFFDINENIVDSEKNQKYLRELFDHIANAQNIIINYKKFDKNLRATSEEFKLSPHFLKQSVSQRWYLIGKVHSSNKKIDIFSLSRIKEIKIDKKNNEYSFPTIDYQDYFKDRIGVSNPDTKNKKTELVKLIIKKGYFELFDSKPPHYSYNRKNNKIIRLNDLDYVETTLQIKPNLEFESILLSYGENVIVKSPDWLKQKMVRRVTSLLSKYK